MEIHKYMNAKSEFMMKMLRLAHQLTDAEIEDIRKATSSAVRMAPIRSENFVMRECVIGDVDALLQANLVSTMKEAEELAVEIIRDAGMVERKHVELMILIREDGYGSEDVQMVGRVGVRIVEDGATKTADGSLRRVLAATPTESKSVGRLNLLYVFIDPRNDDASIIKKALDAFAPALAQTGQEDKHEHSTITESASETVWNLLEGSTRLKIDNGNVKGGMVYQIVSSPTTTSRLNT